MKRLPHLTFVLLFLFSPSITSADDVIAREKARLADWMETAFNASDKPAETPGSPAADRLNVLHQSHKVLAGKTVWNTPIRLGEKTFEHGLYMDAPASVAVSFVKPAERFTALVGIDNNADTRRNPDAPSVRFHVSVAGKRVFSSSVRRLADPPLEVNIPLKDAKEFTLEVDDGGNGRACDQAVWADAAVVTESGETRFLDEFAMTPKRRVTGEGVPFSCTIDGVPFAQLVAQWKKTDASEKRDGKTVRTIRYACPTSGLVIETQITTFENSPAVDWVCRLTNEGTADSPIVADFLPANAALLEAADRPVTLRWSQGDNCNNEAFLPRDDPLAPGESRYFAPIGGRSANSTAAPFFNLSSENRGWVVAIGWTGQWSAEFARKTDGAVFLAAGMERTRFRLKPGECVRTPRIVLLPYEGPMRRGHAKFRRLMLDYYVPRENGRPACPPICHNTAATVYRSGKEATEANQLEIIEEAAKLGCEAYWMDAYWYPRPWHRKVGDWFVRPDDFPRGLKPLADAAHARGMKFVLWFEPERVYPGTKFDKEHPEHLIRLGEDGNRLFNLGDPAARTFLTDFLDARIQEWGVDVYRNDFNFDPLAYWQKQDTTDRQGIAEMKYVEGLYTMWDELRERNPGLQMDNCASGGRRIDLEMCKRSWPLWRSDRNDIGVMNEKSWYTVGLASQVHVGGLSLYIPFHAGPLWSMEPYNVRSCTSGTVVLYERILDAKSPTETAQKALAEVKATRRYFYGDFYPLAKLTASQADWWAYQLHLPKKNEGILFVFRRPQAEAETLTVAPEEIDADATYEVSVTKETYETAPFARMKGSALAQLPVALPRPGSGLIRYRKVSPANANLRAAHPHTP